MCVNTYRRLIHIPIIHTSTDLGSLSESVQRLYVQRRGPQHWNHRTKTVNELWGKISKQIEALDLDYSKVWLYQDGLPHCGHEEKIVRDLAQAGSRNHQLLLELVQKGARIVGTESSELLLEEYALARQLLVSLNSGDTRALKAQQRGGRDKRLLEERDGYIAKRINETLPKGEVGLVFLGLLHSLERRLASDIKISSLGRMATDQS